MKSPDRKQGGPTAPASSPGGEDTGEGGPQKPNAGHRLCIILAALALLLICSLPATAQQYGYTTLLVQGTTNAIANAAATNVHVTANGTNGVTLTKWGDFTLNVNGFTAGALTNGYLDFRYSTSADGTSWNTNAVLENSGGSGWFSLPVNTGGSRFIMNTNINVGSIGYWRIDFITNRTGLTVSNMTIRAYRKPSRYGP